MKSPSFIRKLMTSLLGFIVLGSSLLGNVSVFAETTEESRMILLVFGTITMGIVFLMLLLPFRQTLWITIVFGMKAKPTWSVGM